LQAGSPTITRRLKEVLPTAAKTTPQSDLMAWRTVVNCREREELILNVTVFVVRVWGGQYREELILNVTLFVVRIWGGQYREELILFITLLVVVLKGGQY
jgi:hypothetical protein